MQANLFKSSCSILHSVNGRLQLVGLAVLSSNQNHVKSTRKYLSPKILVKNGATSRIMSTTSSGVNHLLPKSMMLIFPMKESLLLVMRMPKVTSLTQRKALGAH